tara:strand:- start:46 stop:354 length:309 start_codon:yes stop_codon:yes gene_type:complete
MKKRWENIRHTRWFKILTNKFTLTTIGFVVWMLFLDVNSFLIHNELNNEVNELEGSIEYYQTEIARDKQNLEELTTDPAKFEKFAREQYWMKKPGEEIYLIE